jgi:FAD:protein FMN transferase
MNEGDPQPGVSRRGMLSSLVAAGLSLLARPALASAFPSLPGHRPLAVPWDDRFEVAVTFELVTTSNGRRPYIAVFVETLDEKPVRTVGMYLQRGRRSWIRQLRRWFRMERDRQQAGGAGDIAETVSSPTRRPGTYSMIWDGRDDGGTPVEMGSYWVAVECVREGGSYQIMRQQFTFAAEPFATDLPGNPEIGGARVEYRQRA